MKTKLLTKTLLATAVSFAVGTVAAAPYEIIDLGGLGGDQSFGWGINNSGETVGYANGPLISGSDIEREFGIHAFYNDLNQNSDLNQSDDVNGFALKINNSGTIVGYVNEPMDGFVNGMESAVVFSAGSAPNKLVLGDSFSMSRAVSINTAGDIVGFGTLRIDTADGNFVNADRGFKVDINGNVMALPIYGSEQTSDSDSYATSINDNGVILGWSERVTDDNVGIIGSVATILQTDGTFVEIPNFGGREGYGIDINNSGIAVGRAQDDQGLFRPFVFDSNSAVITEIPYIDDNFRDGVANAVNNQNQVVGNILVTPLTIRKYGAFIYENSELSLLNNLVACNSGWDLQQANDINDNGEIIGIGTLGNEVRAFKLIPTGEPIEVCEDEETSNNSGGSSDKLFLLILSLLMIRRFAQNN